MYSKKNILTAFAVFSVVAMLALGLGSIDIDANDPDPGASSGTEPATPVMPEKVSVTYIIGASSVANDATVSAGAFQLLTASPTTIPAGFLFGGWSEKSNDNSKPVTSLTPALTSDETAYKTEYTVYAILLPDHTDDPFTITYVIPDHADVVVTVPMGTAFPVSLLTPAEFETYGIDVPIEKVFTGWFTAPSDGVAVETIGADATRITDGGAGPVYALDDVVVYAVYADNTQVSVTWQIDGAETVEKYYIGAQIAHEVPVKDGYTFEGWVEVSEDKDGSITETPVTEFPLASADAVYKAVFKALPVPEPEPEPEKDDSGMTAVLAILGVVIVIGGALFVWTLKKDKKI